MNSRGFTLVEILMTLLLVGILGAVAITAISSSLSDENFEATLQEMNLIRNAIIGDEKEMTRGVRTSFGYHGDVGALPTNINDLITRPLAVTASTVDNVNRTVIGWNGPYLPTSDPNADYTRDGWGNLYVWSPAAVTPTLVSLGADGAVGGSGLAQDITIEFPASVRMAAVNGFIVTTGAGNPDARAATINIRYPNGTGGVATATANILAAANGAFSFANIPFGVRSLDFTVGGTPYGPVIFNVDRTVYTIPTTLTDTGMALVCAGISIQFQLAASSGIESTTAVNLVVQASAACANPMTVDYLLSDGTAVAPGDYIAGSGTLTIPPGSTTVNLPITIINDAIFEPNETLVATLSNSSTGTLGANTTHTYTITNNDCNRTATILTSNQTYTVPVFCNSLVVRAWGAGGGGGQTSAGKAGDGGAGGYAFTGTLAVLPGDTFDIATGVGGRSGATCAAGGGGAFAGGAEGVNSAGGAGGGFAVGGAGGVTGSFRGGQGRYGGGGGGAGNAAALRGGGGGGATAVVKNSPLTLILVAGGGGGGGGGANGPGGGGGAGGPGCSQPGGNSAAGTRGSGGGGGACTAIAGGGTGNGVGRTPASSALATGTNGEGGRSGGTCASGSGKTGAVRFEPAP